LRVSILILLEVILEADTGDFRKVTRIGFNPYFTGSNSGRRSDRGRRYR